MSVGGTGRVLLLEGSLLDVVGELRGRHPVRLLAIGFELGGPELSLGKGSRGVGDRLVVGPRLERGEAAAILLLGVPRVGAVAWATILLWLG